MYRSKIQISSEELLPDTLVTFFNDIPSSNPETQTSEPLRKRRRVTKEPGTKASRIDDEEDYLTLALITIDLMSTYDLSAPLSGFLLSQDDGKELPVLLRRSQGNRGGAFSLQATSSDGGTVVDLDIPSTIPLQTLDVLARAIDLPIPRRKNGARTQCSISCITLTPPCTVFRINVRVVLPNAKHLLPIGPRLPPGIYSSECPVESWSPREFYDSVFVPAKDATAPRFPPIHQLNCQLYPFQQRAVRWLLRREGVDFLGNTLTAYDVDQAPVKLPYGFVETSYNSRVSWFSPLFGIMTTDQSLTRDTGLNIRGGILAEEMGLGKTVEMIALICLHQSTTRATQNMCPSSLPSCSATLIITPPSIIQQWKSELHTLAPHLQVMIYEGLRTESGKCDNEQLLTQFLSSDVILTTYNVLAREIHHSGHTPDRDLRHGKKYRRRLSPLIQLMWWRVVLDEAQMIESGIRNAAKVAQLIPRQNAWAVSGTPLRKDATDLLGLLVFLRCWPYCQPQLWDRLVKFHKDIFRDIFRTIALRHTKELIKDDIELPSQKRIVITIPFTQIEEQHYSTLYQEMCDDCGLTVNGRPLDEAWDPNSTKTIEKMRSWLARLRQTVLHPSVGGRNRRALGQGKGPLRTVGEVLEVMREQNDTACRVDEKALLMSQARRGQLLEHAKRSEEALQVWLQTLEESKVIVHDCRHHLESDLGIPKTVTNATRASQEPDEEATRAAQTGILRQRLRAALEVEHMCTFFVANAYYQIKSDEAVTEQGSEAFQTLQKLEESAYEKAQLIRKEILVETRTKALTAMGLISEKAQNHSFVEIPEMVPLSCQGGIESRNIMTKLDALLAIIDQQAALLDEWRGKMVQLLLLPLVDEEETDLQGDEYETSTKQQDEVYVYVDALRAIIADRHDILTGQTNTRVEHEIKFALDQAKEGIGHSPELLKKLLSVRRTLKPPPDLGSVRGIITQLRELKTDLRGQMQKTSTRASAELAIVDATLHKLHGIANDQIKVVNSLDRELELFRDTMNLRLEYYRQLQQISDTVAPYEDDLDEESLNVALAGMKDAETQIQLRIATLKSRARYLDHLRDEAADVDGQRLCTICQQHFETGILTSCGHSYCLECIRLWWKNCAYKNCPTCKKRLSRNDFHQITYKPQELTMQEETQAKERGSDEERQTESTSIYSGIRSSTLNQIKNIDVDGSFGTKIDTLARHLFWIRENDPGAKSVVFSQFRDFLDILAKAFTQFKIGFTSIDRKDGIQKFKNDPSMECFFLHAKAHSSGLNLVNATHVFLCEPLINTAIELQAISRVHRIGQHLPTTVWMYLVQDTVEKAIYDISVTRRMSHISQTKDDCVREVNGTSMTESKIEAANSLELQEAPLSKLFSKGVSGGEMVNQEDVWQCLFGLQAKPSGQASQTVKREVARHLRASAVDDRLRQSVVTPADSACP